MDSKNSTDAPQPSLPFGAIDDDPRPTRRKRSSKKKKKASSRKAAPASDAPAAAEADGPPAADAAPKPRAKVRTRTRRSEAAAEGEGEARRPEPRDAGGESRGEGGGSSAEEGSGEGRRRPRRRRRGGRPDGERKEGGGGSSGSAEGHKNGAQGGNKRRRSRGGKNQKKRFEGEASGGSGEAQVGGGLFMVDKGGFGVLRRVEDQWCASKQEIYVPKRLIQQHKLQEGSLVEGKLSRGQKHKFQVHEITSIDGKPPGQLPRITFFKNLTSIDPDFHYAVGDSTDNVSMRIVDLLCPIGRGQRGLIVAPPRSGKTTLMREFAHGIETTYPDVHLMVLLIDERPEEATDWKRSLTTGQVFVSTSDETSKRHIQLAEAVWKRCMRLVELGEDVVLLMDSITRLARAYNNQAGSSGRTMSGGLDSRAMERPRKIFGSARNTEKAGSLTILGTTLIETGSRMDSMVFEEFKGTGNMELVLSRKLADRRIFPAIDVERSGTRKEEKLVGLRRLRLIHVLRRVLSRMNFIEAMELLITRLSEVEKTDDFLKRFEVDPEA